MLSRIFSAYVYHFCFNRDYKRVRQKVWIAIMYQLIFYNINIYLLWIYRLYTNLLEGLCTLFTILNIRSSKW